MNMTRRSAIAGSVNLKLASLASRRILPFRTAGLVSLNSWSAQLRTGARRLKLDKEISRTMWFRLITDYR
jgi:hypothetical protein